MPPDVSKAGFSSVVEFVVSMFLIFLCIVYCTWIDYVIWYYLWRKTQDITKDRIGSSISKVRSLSDVNGQVQIPIAMNNEMQTLELQAQPMDIIKNENENRNDKSTTSSVNTDLDMKVKVIVTLYVGSCWLYYVALICEFMIHLMDSSIDKICIYAPYSFHGVIVTESLFFLFYVVRIHVILKNSVFELSTTTLLIMGILPVVTLTASILGYLGYVQSHNCEFILTTLIVLGVCLFVHLFWNVALFIFFVFQLRRATSNANMSSIQWDLKNYLKRLFRLFLMSETFAFIVYGIFITPGLIHLIGPVSAITLCVNCTMVLLSFGFGKSVFPCFKK